MAKHTIIEEKPVCLAEVNSLLKKFEERDGQLDPRSSKTRDYFTAFKDVLPLEEKVIKLKTKLEKLEIMKLKEEHIIRILNFLPKDEPELQLLLAELNLSKKELGEILNVINAIKND